MRFPYNWCNCKFNMKINLDLVEDAILFLHISVITKSYEFLSKSKVKLIFNANLKILIHG